MKIHLLDTDGPDIRIEIVPLIDVIFCILTFFILAAVSLTRQQAINLDLPKASTGVAQTQATLLVSIDPVGQTYIDKQLVGREQLYQSLLNYTQGQPKGIIVLNASPLVSYNEVIQVLDLLRSVGGDRVALATSPVEQPTLSPLNPTPPNPNSTPNPSLPLPVNPLPSVNPGSVTPGSVTPSPGNSPAPNPVSPGPGAMPVNPQ
jgi:biopolymer transport protein ExbD